MLTPTLRYSLSVLLLVGAPSLTAATFVKTPWLVPAGQAGKMHVVFQTSAAPGSVQVSYGTTPDASDAAAPAPTMTNSAFVYRATLSGLNPGQRIYYKVTMDGVVNTGSFLAPRGVDANDLTFYAYGDTRTNPQYHNNVAKAMLSDVNLVPNKRASFVLHSADYVATGSSESDWTSTFFNASTGPDIRALLANLPLYGVIGNHEGSAGLPLLKKYWSHELWATSGWYFSFDYGPVHVAVVDIETGTSFAVGSAQYNWLKADLQNSTAPLKVVTWHSPAYSAGGGHSDHATAKSTLVPLCEQNGVQIVINGDNHYYARIPVNGVHHITSGGGGAPLYTPVASTPNLAKSSSSYHFIRFDVSPSLGTATGTVLNTTGGVIESFTVPLNTAASDIVITGQPQSTTVTAPAAATFSVTATGSGTLGYQWKKNGTAISGATSASYTTPATTTTDSGAKYSVTVTNSTGSKTSNEATLTVNGAPVAPAITTQPVSKTVAAPATATFSVVASGTAPLSYQWKKNNVAIPGATAASYTTPATTSADNGAVFAVTVTNSVGSVTSSNATLTVTTSTTFNEVESNNTAATANVVPDSASKIVGYISSSSDGDYFKLNVGTGRTLKVVMTGPSGSSYDYDLYFYNAAGTTLAKGEGSTTSETVSWTNSGSAAIITVHVKRYKGSSTSTPYNLVVTR